MFIVDDLLAWLVGLVADAGRKKLVTLVLGSDQERALRSAVEAAVAATAAQLAPSGEQADQLAVAVGEVFRGAPKVALAGQRTLLEALQAGIAAQVAVLDDPAAAGTGRSSLELLRLPGGVVAQTLAGHLVHEITVRGAQGGSLTPLADQLNHDMTHLQGERLEGMLAQVISMVTELAQAGHGPQVPRKPVRLAPRPARLAGREELLADLDAKLTGDGDTGPRIVALCGLGGAGKTSVALEYAHRHLGEVGVAWQFAAEDVAVLAAGVAELAAQLGIQDLTANQDPLASVHAVLAASPAGWLLVLITHRNGRRWCGSCRRTGGGGCWSPAATRTGHRARCWTCRCSTRRPRPGSWWSVPATTTSRRPRNWPVSWAGCRWHWSRQARISRPAGAAWPGT